MTMIGAWLHGLWRRPRPLSDARQALDRARRDQHEVDQIVSCLRANRERNHFAERIDAAYGLARRRRGGK